MHWPRSVYQKQQSRTSSLDHTSQYIHYSICHFFPNIAILQIKKILMIYKSKPMFCQRHKNLFVLLAVRLCRIKFGRHQPSIQAIWHTPLRNVKNKMGMFSNFFQCWLFQCWLFFSVCTVFCMWLSEKMFCFLKAEKTSMALSARDLHWSFGVWSIIIRKAFNDSVNS